MEDINEGLEYLVMAIDDAIDHLKNELTKLRAGKASPNMVSSLMVDYYGAPAPISQVANVSSQDARTLIIKPWEKNMLAIIEQSIFASNIGITPQNDGEQIRLVIPPLTEERRKDIVKQVKAKGEDARIAVRQGRQKAMDVVRKAVKDGVSEDEGKRHEDTIEKKISEANELINKIMTRKEEEVMTV